MYYFSLYCRIAGFSHSVCRKIMEKYNMLKKVIDRNRFGGEI